MPTAELASQPVNVLLIEDSPDDAFLMERHLRRSGFVPVVTRVERKEEMGDALRAEPPPDVILADYNLPHFSGPAALQLLRSSGVDIPFIMMSGAVSEETAVESMRAGAQDYISKGNLTRLIPAIERELKEALARRKRVAAEQALQASEARFHRLVEAMPLSLLIVGEAGRIVYLNRAAERLLGYGQAELATRVVAIDAICPELRKSYGAPGEVAKMLEPFESICTTSSGQTVEALIGVAPLNPEDPAAEQQFAAFLADLTLQKKSEEMLRQTEKLAVAGRLAASIAHEINNPLEAIINCLYLISTSELPEACRSYVEMAQNELNRVTQITVQTLRFYRRSSRPARIDVHELIDGVVTLFQTRIDAASITVVREFRANLLVFAHDGEIRQVIVNLIGNAVDALVDGGRIRIRTSAVTEPRTGKHGLRLTVADDGIGMDDNTQARIFEPFFSTKGITGAGLGLWVSKEIIGRHGGSLRVRSRRTLPGSPGGAVFTLFIPANSGESLLVAEP